MALIDPLGSRRLELDELNTRARRAARGFTRLGVAPGDGIAVLLRNDFAFFEACLAASSIGAYSIPINWHLVGDEVAYILADSGAKLLVVHADLYRQVRDAIPAALPVIVVATPLFLQQAYGLSDSECTVDNGDRDWEPWLASFEPTLQVQPPSPTSIIYTSGTTGRPKGVKRQIRSAEELAARRAGQVRTFGIVVGMRTVVTGPMYHGSCYAHALGAAAVGDVYLKPKFDAFTLLEWIDRYAITNLNLVPTMFVRLLRLPAEVRASSRTDSLRFVVHAAAPCPPEVKRAMIDWWGPVINEFYGSTESGAVTFCNASEWLEKPGTVGRPIDAEALAVLSEQGLPVRQGDVGELHVRLAPHMEFTYHNNPQKRAELDVDGRIALGDIGYQDESGYLFLCDRKRDMIISGGVNIYPAEVEAALIGMPGIRDCAVFGIPDLEMGENVAAAVECEAGASPSYADIQHWLKNRLAGYKCPRQIDFVATLPRDDSGKALKNVLKAPYWADTGRRI